MSANCLDEGTRRTRMCPSGHVDRVDIVAEDNCSAGEGAAELLKELAKPAGFSDGVGDSSIPASTLERETVCCRLEDHEMRLSSRNTQ
jgi:hypothetical protein